MPLTLTLGLFLVDKVEPPGLDFAIDESSANGGEELLGLSVAGGLAVCAHDRDMLC